MVERTDEILRVENLAFEYGKVEVWRGIDLSLRSGEVAFLVGQNGSGKSTLFRCLAGLSKPKEGEMFLLGERFVGSSREQRAQLAFVSDTPTFYDDLTAQEHIQFVMRANRVTDEYPRAEELLEEFGLRTHAGQYPSSFSRGMREKLAIIIALLVRPQLYLFDEPYGPLDHAASEMVSAKIKECAQEGASVLLSCHHAVPNIVPDKVFLLEEGKVEQKEPSVLRGMWETVSSAMACDDDSDRA